MICETCGGNKGFCGCKFHCPECNKPLDDGYLGGGGLHEFGELPFKSHDELVRAGVMHYNCHGSAHRNGEFLVFPNGDVYQFKWELHDKDCNNKKFGWMKIR